jgi:hypothetical protein
MVREDKIFTTNDIKENIATIHNNDLLQYTITLPLRHHYQRTLHHIHHHVYHQQVFDLSCDFHPPGPYVVDIDSPWVEHHSSAGDRSLDTLEVALQDRKEDQSLQQQAWEGRNQH